ncbi:MAG: DUF1080 domain-containing protein, partial [bacterium]|nr:DUF1080 domain-containing protein [bacterium]
DPSILPLDAAAWTIYDSPGENPATSNWQVGDGFVTELSNLYRGDAKDPNPAMERAGTFRIYASDAPMKDGVLTLELASSDDDVLGVAFRFNGPDRHYLWSMDRQRAFHALACKSGDSYRLLASNTKAYDQNIWYQLRIELAGPKMTVYLNGEKDFELEDATFQEGTFALYAWGCAGAKFRNVRWADR